VPDMAHNMAMLLPPPPLALLLPPLLLLCVLGEGAQLLQLLPAPLLRCLC